MRLFVGSRLDPDARADLRPRVEGLVDAAGGCLRPVPPASEHFTHVFLGEREVDPAQILDALAPLAAAPPVVADLGAPRVFPPRGRPRLVCLQTSQGSDALAALAAAVRERLLPLFPDLRDVRLKPPHVTLARFAKRARGAERRRVSEHLAIEPTGWTATVRLDRVELIRSSLSSAGATYQTAGSVRLGGADRPESGAQGGTVESVSVESSGAAPTTPSAMSSQAVIDRLGLQPLPDEGGMFAETWRDEAGSAIYFLVRPGDFSAMHRLSVPELWHHYAGAAVSMLLLGPGGAIDEPRLGIDLEAGERPFVPVRAGVWMGAETTGDWSLLGTTMAPPFAAEQFELGARARLVEAYPAAAERIARLTRE